MASQQESNSLSLKRKLVDDCNLKDCKSRRVKVENGSLFDSSAKRCHCCCTRPNLASDCVNYLKSGVPSRFMFYKQGSWHNFPEQIMKTLIEEFKGNKSSVVIVMDNEPLLVDFLSMTLVNLKSRKQRSVAWFDDTGKCFFPSLFFDEEADELTKVDASTAEGSVQGIMLDKVANSPPEVVKQVVLESRPPVPQKPSTADILRKKITCVERGSESFLFVLNLFLSGMGPFATPNNILHIHRYSPNDIAAQCRLEAFERQMRSTKEERGDANVRYGWLGSRKNDIVRILINGFGSTGNPAEKVGLNAGVYLSPKDRAFTSIGLCDVDEKGVQYMLLCRAILGNVEAVNPGSQECFPSSEIYDSGVDDCSNPKCYVMWPSHLSTHIRLEYLVSFRLAPKVQEYLLGLKGLWFHPSPTEVAVDISTLQPVMCETGKGPTSPWISFRVLFAIIQDSMSSVARELLFHHYEELKENKITREEMVKKMIIIVGEKLLLDTLKKLHYCPSLWYKSPTESMSSDPPSTVSEPMCMDKTSRNCASTVSRHCGDSHMLNMVPENSLALSTKGCDTLAPGVAPKDHDSPAPSGGPEKSTSAGAIYWDSSSVNVAPKGCDSPVSSMSPENCASLSTKHQDPFAARMAPMVRDVLVKVSENTASSSVEACNSAAPGMGPNGHASLAPANALRSHGFQGPSFTKVCESLVPSLTLGNSGSAGAKCLNSDAPSMTSEGQEFLALSMVPQSSGFLVGKSQGAVTSGVTPQVRSPASMVPGTFSSLTTEGCDSLALSITPRGHASPAWNNKPKGHESPAPNMTPNGHGCPALCVTTKGQNAPTLRTGVSKDQTLQCGASNKFAEPGIEASSTIARAADTLVALSALGEKGR